MKPNTKSVLVINDTTLNTGINLRERAYVHASNLWHKVYVQNAAKYSREFVLRTIMNALYPLDFIPVSYSIEDDFATFLLKNCGSAIDRMCMLNLTIPHPDAQKKLPPFKLTIYLKHAHASEVKIEIQSNLTKVLQKRFSPQTKTLNLDYFIKDHDLTEFCPLSQPKLLYFVLHLSKDFDIEHLKLNGNEITTLQPLEALQGYKSAKTLISVDARKNNIEKAEELNILKHFKLTELILSDNPLCEKISEEEYIKMVKTICPTIRKLDDVPLPEIGNIPSKRNYLCVMEGANFVDQFLEHYFTLYDSYNRDTLMNMYHKNALFSITSHYSGSTSDTMSGKLYIYKKFCRNLTAISDVSKSYEYLIQGAYNIGNVFKMLPETEHDPYTFAVDLMQFTDNCKVFSISGVFKEPGQSLLESEYFYSFARTFVLTPVSDYEYMIVNEMLHVTNATPAQQAAAFKVVKIPGSTSMSIPDAKTQAEKNDMVRSLVSLTHLLPIWATKLLKEVKYNFKKALVLFTDLFKAEKLPADAFDFHDFHYNTEQDEAPTQPQYIEPIQTQLPQVDVESIKAMLQPVDNVIQIKPHQKLPSPSSSNKSSKSSKPPKVTPPKSTPPIHSTPIPIAQPSAKAESKPVSNSSKESKKSEKSARVLQQIIISNELPKTTPSSSFVERSTKNVKELVENIAIAPPTLVTKSMNSGKGITINLQKTKMDPLNAIDTNVGDFKDYVNDETIIKALSMTLDTPIHIVKHTLDDACKQVTNKYTFGLKYYKAVGREFYRYNLCSEARNFLTNAMAIVPKKMGEQLYCLFTLFEIQFGNANVAENMMLIIAESFEIDNAAIFMSQQLPKTNVVFARKVFGMIAKSEMETEKKKILLKAHVDFEIVFGNVETLKHAKMLYEEIMASAPASQSADVGESSKNTTSVECVTEVVQDDATKKKEEDSEIIVLGDDSPSDKDQTSTKSAEASTDNGITFREFRDRLLQMANVMPKIVDQPDVEEFLKLTDKQSIEQKGEKLLYKYGKEFYVIRTVLKKWKEYGNSAKIAKIMPDVKKRFPFDSKIVNPLILYLKVRDDLCNKNYAAAKSKLFTHIKISQYVDIIQVFEDLMADTGRFPENVTFIESFLMEIVTDYNQIPIAKIKLLKLIFITFCRQNNSTKADLILKKDFSKEILFHPDDILINEDIKTWRGEYEKKNPPGIRNLQQRGEQLLNKNTYENKIEEMRMYYFLGDANTARYRRNLFKDNNYDNMKRFTFACSYFEAIYGTPMVGIKHLRRAVDDSLSFLCVSMILNYRNESIGPLKQQLKQLFSDIFRICNPKVQELLYKYYKDWIKVGLNIFDPSLNA